MATPEEQLTWPTIYDIHDYQCKFGVRIRYAGPYRPDEIRASSQNIENPKSGLTQFEPFNRFCSDGNDPRGAGVQLFPGET